MSNVDVPCSPETPIYKFWHESFSPQTTCRFPLINVSFLFFFFFFFGEEEVCTCISDVVIAREWDPLLKVRVRQILSRPHFERKNGIHLFMSFEPDWIGAPCPRHKLQHFKSFTRLRGWKGHVCVVLSSSLWQTPYQFGVLFKPSHPQQQQRRCQFSSMVLLLKPQHLTNSEHHVTVWSGHWIGLLLPRGLHTMARTLVFLVVFKFLVPKALHWRVYVNVTSRKGTTAKNCKIEMHFVWNFVHFAHATFLTTIRLMTCIFSPRCAFCCVQRKYQYFEMKKKQQKKNIAHRT